MNVTASDRIGCSFVFASHGYAIRVEADRAEVIDGLRTALPYGAQIVDGANADSTFAISSSDDGTAELTVDGERVAGPAEPAEILRAFETNAVIRIAERAPQHVFVHAGVIGWRGHAIVFPGYSFSGKTTLVADCVRAGASYFSDEYAVIDRAGLIHPFARPLQVRKPGEEAQSPTGVDAFGGRAAEQPLPPSLVILTRYEPGAEWLPRPVTPGLAALEMLQYTMSAQYGPDAAFEALRSVVSQAPVLRGLRGETRQIVEFLAHRYP